MKKFTIELNYNLLPKGWCVYRGMRKLRGFKTRREARIYKKKLENKK